MRSVAVVGISSFGLNLCRFLAEQGVQVLALDQDERRIDLVKDTVHRALICDATRRQTLEELELDQLDEVVVSLGERMDTSVLVTLYLKQLGVKRITAKAFSIDHQQILEHVGAHRVVFPERDMARNLAHELASVNLLQYIPLDSEFSVMELTPPLSWLGRTLQELQIRRNHDVQILLVHDCGSTGGTVLPDGNHRFAPHERLVVLGRQAALERLRTMA